jgi:hypothetical protein
VAFSFFLQRYVKRTSRCEIEIGGQNCSIFLPWCWTFFCFGFLTLVSCFVLSHDSHYAEFSGYFEGKTRFLQEAKNSTQPIEFYDSNTGKLLFTAPIGRTMDDFLIESKGACGWIVDELNVKEDQAIVFAP